MTPADLSLSYIEAQEAVVKVLAEQGRVSLLPYEPLARQIVEALGFSEPCPECRGYGIVQKSESGMYDEHGNGWGDR